MKKNILILLVFLAAFFPFISILRTPFDTQPWAVLLACLFLGVIIFEERSKFWHTFPKPLLILSIIFVYAFVWFVLHALLSSNVDYLAGIRSLWDYLSLIVMAYIGYRFWQNIPVKLFLASVATWLLFALGQLVFGVKIVSGLLARFSTGGYRGLTSLAPEPAFYAALCVYFLILNEFFYKEKKYNTAWYFAVVIALLLQVVISYSGVGIMMVLLFCGAKLLQLILIQDEFNEKKKQIAVIFLCLLAISNFFLNKQLKHTRGGYLVQAAVQQPEKLVKNDVSVSTRLINPLIAFYGGIIQTHGLGTGLGNKSLVVPPPSLAELYGKNRTIGNRIEGGIVQSVYELGIVGLIFLGTVWYILLGSIWKNKSSRGTLLVSTITVFIPISMFGSLANPMVGLLLGIHLFYLTKTI